VFFQMRERANSYFEAYVDRLRQLR
jgi:hypothetical protein